MKRKGKKCYADGGRVQLETKDGKTRKIAKPRPQLVDGKPSKPSPGMLGSGSAAAAGQALRGVRGRQMRELGLKDGGKVSKKR